MNACVHMLLKASSSYKASALSSKMYIRNNCENHFFDYYYNNDFNSVCVTLYQVLHKSIRIKRELATDKETQSVKRLNFHPRSLVIKRQCHKPNPRSSETKCYIFYYAIIYALSIHFVWWLPMGLIYLVHQAVRKTTEERFQDVSPLSG